MKSSGGGLGKIVFLLEQRFEIRFVNHFIAKSYF